MKEKETVSFSYDSLKILGVIGDNVFIQGTIEFFDDCILEVSRALLKETLTYWLDDKKDYYEGSGHFCGQMGSLRSDDYEEYPEKDRLTIGNEVKPVRTFKVNSFDPNTDMEHG